MQTVLTRDVAQAELLGRALGAATPEALRALLTMAQVSRAWQRRVAAAVHANVAVLCAPVAMTDAHLGAFRALTTLDLAWNQWVTVAGLAALPALTTLHLGWNKAVMNTGLAALPALTTLNLGIYSSVTDAGLATLPALTTLDLGSKNVSVTAAGIAGLRARGVWVVQRLRPDI